MNSENIYEIGYKIKDLYIESSRNGKDMPYYRIGSRNGYNLEVCILDFIGERDSSNCYYITKDGDIKFCKSKTDCENIFEAIKFGWEDFIMLSHNLKLEILGRNMIQIKRLKFFRRI